jgi:hypothetical protein
MKILSQGKFRNFDHVSFMGNKPICEVVHKNTTIRCTHDHKILIDDIWVEAKDIENLDYSVVDLNISEDVYDIIEVEDTNSYSVKEMEVHNCSFLYIDETAFVENWDDFFTSVFPTISSGNTTKILLTSTPNGLNHFYKTCDGAKKGKNGYQYVEVKWDMVPGRGEAWKKETLEAMDFDYEKFAQEFETEFSGSSGTLISGTKLKQLVYQDPIHEKDGLTMYQEPMPNQQYVCIADVSRGKGLDYSAFHIINVTKMPYHQVCTYRDNTTTPIEYTKIIYELSKLYNNAYVMIEINDIGDQVASSLYEDYEYENMLFTENNGRSGKRLVSGFSNKNCDKGVRTTKSVKSVGCSMLKLLIEQNQFIINDFQTIKELSTFSKKGNSWEAEANCHDDLVMGLVLFAWLSNQKFFKEFTDINTINQLRDLNDEQLMNNLVPFGIINDGRDDYQDEIVTAGRDDRWLLQEEIMWN